MYFFLIINSQVIKDQFWISKAKIKAYIVSDLLHMHVITCCPLPFKPEGMMNLPLYINIWQKRLYEYVHVYYIVILASK